MIGVLAATALNALTTRTTVESVLRLVTSYGEVYFAFTETPPRQLDVELSRYRTWRRQRDVEGAATAAPAAAIDLLERLTALHAAGQLSDEEFATQKAAVLG